MKALLLAVAWVNCQQLPEDETSTLRSWTETARVVGDAYCRDEVSEDHFRQTLAEARIELERESTARDALRVIDRIESALNAGARTQACAAVADLAVIVTAKR